MTTPVDRPTSDLGTKYQRKRAREDRWLADGLVKTLQVLSGQDPAPVATIEVEYNP